MIIFHLALADQWAAAVQAGEYRISTRGASLDEVGFIHAATEVQVDDVQARFYADAGDLVLLTIDTDRLSSPWQLDPVGQEDFPHIYGPLNLDAVVDTGVKGSIS
ncbi:DUF952 domain-containing protein [Aeromicrobium sp. CF3.5]|uniref:DUF952 domain-containing protein n=1 Tax=Aeromicrobium sp. CF3.5 TaxID=3373078 RepID=UPI003EE642E2